MRLDTFGTVPDTQNASVDALNQGQLGAVMQGANYDKIYTEAWESLIRECGTELDTPDYAAAVRIKSIDDFRQELPKLEAEHPDKESAEAIRSLVPILGHYDAFSNTFVKLMKSAVDVSMMWGLLALVISHSLRIPEARVRIGALLRKIAHKLEYLNEYGSSASHAHETLKEIAVSTHTDLVRLWLKVITIFRDNPDCPYLLINQYRRWLTHHEVLEESVRKDSVLTEISGHFDEVIIRLEESVSRINQFVTLAVRSSLQAEASRLQRIQGDAVIHEAASLPCHFLPAGQNPSFYGRESEISELITLLDEQTHDGDIASVAICGLGGLGKTQLALHYSLAHLGRYDAVLWLRADTEASLESSFSEAAMQLKLPDISWHQHAQNRVEVLRWLQQTRARWLLVYDNVEKADVLLRHWPTATKGHILLTSRKHAFARQPAKRGLSIQPFSDARGATYLLSQLQIESKDQEYPEANSDLMVARKLSESLHGHPLALTQLAAMITTRSTTLQKMLQTFQKRPKRVLDVSTPELLHAGYTNSMTDLFLEAIESLKEETLLILGVMSFLSPDAIDKSFLVLDDGDIDAPNWMDIFAEEFEFSDGAKPLIDLALVNYKPEVAQYSIHRLVQLVCKLSVPQPKRQYHFEAACKIVHGRFPKQNGDQRYGNRLSQCDKHIQQVYALRDHYQHSITANLALDPTDDYCMLMCDATWYCVEIHQTKEAQPMMKLTMDAVEKCGFKERHAGHYARLCSNSGRLWAQQGKFQCALTQMQECQKIRENESLDLFSITNNIGNLYISMGSLDEAYTKHKEAALMPSSRSTGFTVMNDLNIGRILVAQGHFEEAETRFSHARQLNQDENLLIHIQHHHASLLRAQKKYVEANAEYQAAIDGLERRKDLKNLLHATCLFKQGLIALDEKNETLARSKFQESIDIHKFQQTPACEQARVMYALSLVELDKTEAEALLQNAETTRKELQGDKYDPACQTRQSYDSLVDGQLR